MRQAIRQRLAFLLEQGLAERQDDQLMLKPNLLATLRSRELAAVGKSIEADTHLTYRETEDGESIRGVYRRSVELASGRFAMPLATMVGLTPPPHGAWKDNNGKPIYFDSIDNSAYIMGKARHSARDGWIYIDGETFAGARADIGGDPTNPDLKIAWKYLYTSKDTWLGPQQNLGAIGSAYNLTMDPFEKYDMTFNGAVSTRSPTTSPGRYSGYDNGWAVSLMAVPIGEFDKSIVDFPNMKRSPGGASNDTSPDLQHPDNPLPLMDIKKLVNVIGAAD